MFQYGFFFEFIVQDFRFLDNGDDVVDLEQDLSGFKILFLSIVDYVLLDQVNDKLVCFLER